MHSPGGTIEGFNEFDKFGIARLPGSGASSTRTGAFGDNLSPENTARVRSGMTKHEVENILGTPAQKSTAAEGRVLWTWHYRRERSPDGFVYRPVHDQKAQHSGSITALFLGDDGTLAFIRRN